MPLVLADRVRETTTTTGQGTVTLAGAVTGFQSFSVIGNGNTTYYTIAGQGTSEWEVGIGTYTSSGTTLSRDTVLASSAGAPTKTTFSAGTKDVFVTYTAARSVNVDGTSIDTFGLGAAQGDILYASGTDNFVLLNKNTTATRYLANTGTTNNPQWDQVNLANGVTGDLPFSNLTQGSALSVLGVTGNATADVASIAAGTDHQVLRRSGTALAFGAVNLAQSAAVTGTLPVANGGTGQSSYLNGELLIGNTTGNTLAKATLTQGTGVTVTNGAGSITIAIGQAVATGSNVQFNSIGVNTAASGTAGQIRATSDVVAHFSDDRLKTRLGNIENALDKICSLEGFYYEPSETAQALGYEVKRAVGVSAQSMKKVLPEIVVPAPIDEKYMTIQYDKALPLIVEAIKELRDELTSLKKEIK